MTLGLEPCNRYETHLFNTAAGSGALIRPARRAAVTIHLDTYHTNIEEKGVADGLAEGAGRVRYVHLSESDRGVPGSGNVDWRSVMIALKAPIFPRPRHRVLRQLDAGSRPLCQSGGRSRAAPTKC